MTSFFEQVQSVLMTTPARWLAITSFIPANLLARQPSPGEWSALDCLGHLLDTERYVFPARVEHFLAGRDLEAFNPDTQESALAQRPAELAAEFARLRESSLAALKKVSHADLMRNARHSELGMVTLGEMLHQWVAHDLNHTIQAERALMQPFIAGSGPWRGYFRDHDMEVIHKP
jgi:DinB superfamily